MWFSLITGGIQQHPNARSHQATHAPDSTAGRAGQQLRTRHTPGVRGSRVPSSRRASCPIAGRLPGFPAASPQRAPIRVCSSRATPNRNASGSALPICLPIHSGSWTITGQTARTWHPGDVPRWAPPNDANTAVSIPKPGAQVRILGRAMPISSLVNAHGFGSPTERRCVVRSNSARFFAHHASVRRPRHKSMVFAR